MWTEVVEQLTHILISHAMPLSHSHNKNTFATHIKYDVFCVAGDVSNEKDADELHHRKHF